MCHRGGRAADRPQHDARKRLAGLLRRGDLGPAGRASAAVSLRVCPRRHSVARRVAPSARRVPGASGAPGAGRCSPVRAMAECRDPRRARTRSSPVRAMARCRDPRSERGGLRLSGRWRGACSALGANARRPAGRRHRGSEACHGSGTPERARELSQNIPQCRPNHGNRCPEPFDVVGPVAPSRDAPGPGVSVRRDETGALDVSGSLQRNASLVRVSEVWRSRVLLQASRPIEPVRSRDDRGSYPRPAPDRNRLAQMLRCCWL